MTRERSVLGGGTAVLTICPTIGLTTLTGLIDIGKNSLRGIPTKMC